MIVIESKIAKRYAQAFLNVHKDACTPELMKTCNSFATFLTKNTLFQATLAIPSLSFDTKKTFIEHVAHKLTLPDIIKKLTFLLLKEKRIDLLKQILKQILFINKKRDNKYHFNVTTSHTLTNDEQKTIITFIKKHVPNHITATFSIDETLISGIKIQGITRRWERSIAKQLRSIEQKIVRQEELW